MSAVLVAYAALRDQALARSPIELHGYIRRLHRSWQTRLRGLSGLFIAGNFTERTAFLVREITKPDLDEDTLIRWLDVFPEAIEEMALRAA